MQSLQSLLSEIFIPASSDQSYVQLADDGAVKVCQSTCSGKCIGVSKDNLPADFYA